MEKSIIQIDFNTLDVEPRHLSIIKKILNQFIPNKQVWAYGSRVTGKAKKYSDLDLVIFDVDYKNISDLKEAFEESDLPYRVDIMDWNKIPEPFKESILKNYIVI